MEKVKDCLTCPICFEIPVYEVFQCRNGHQICNRCCGRLEHCPTCRTKYDNPKIRNRAMEDLLDTVVFDCIFKKNGCTEKVHRSKLATHPSECKFRPYHFCKLLGYKNCEFDGHQVPLLLLRHLQDSHNVISHHAQDLIIEHDNFMNAAHASSLILGATKLWPPVIIKLDKDNYGPTFILFGAVRASHCSWICLYMGDSQDEASKYQFSFTIRNVFGHGDNYEFKWKAVPVSFKRAEQVLKNPHLTLPMSFIKDHVLLGSNLLGVFLNSLRLEVGISKIGKQPGKVFDAGETPLHLNLHFK